MMETSHGMKTLRPDRDHQVISAANLDLAESAAFVERNRGILGMHGQGYLLVSRLPCAAQGLAHQRLAEAAVLVARFERKAELRRRILDRESGGGGAAVAFG